MKEEFLLNTMADIDDAYIREAAQPAKARKRKLPWKALVAAALIPLLTVTAYASQYMKNNTENFTPADAWAKVNPDASTT